MQGLSIIFCGTRARTDELEAKLREMGYAVFKLHGKMTVDERKESLANFSQQGGGAVLITTDVMARGVDIPSCRAVINFDMPYVFDEQRRCETNDAALETYYHRIGRAGRFGRDGRAICFLTTPRDIACKEQLRSNFQAEGAAELITETTLEKLEAEADAALQDSDDEADGGGQYEHATTPNQSF